MTDYSIPAAPYGYLLVHFIEDPKSYAERIYLDLSDGDNPEHWNPLNHGKPVLTSPFGTKGVRDPYLVRNPETGRVYILATDLQVFTSGHGSESGSGWYEWSHHGSTNLIIWESDDLVHWSEPRTLDVSRKADGTHAELGMAWAPEALWVPDYYPQGREGGRGAFVLYWSSKLFADDDPRHENPDVYDRVLWGATADFTNDTYEYGGVFIDEGYPTIDTTMLARGGRVYRATKHQNERGIVLESTDGDRWWEPQAQWSVIQDAIGADWTENGDPRGVEGPALFASHSNDEVYLYVDVIPSIGYRPMVTTDIDHGFEYLKSDEFDMAPHTKHGGVLSLTRAEYERVLEADRAGAYIEDKQVLQA
ncbi:glycoside hydrolase family 43 protein [Bifidobacterium eulemuris]|uniref:1,4-beta-xylanase n=1 Tax=Bifidobacterium eulemuris TaxID=1765219 RepID=A0A261GAC6_9BIFI|nr:glycoside hydrolase family 43 protein [Bifidobacterium eulemuris]OZG68135.1 1,4-beta-xylanase [Bifidobacterium eulemuris]QOL31802.1 glycoside hydrolase family 43 protein [Bifidobacterium eulemuris]